MRNLRNFKTRSAYTTAVPTLIHPTISYIEEGNDVKYVSQYDKNKKNYLTFEALEAGTFTMAIPSEVRAQHLTSVSYSIDGGETWTTTNVDDTNQTITTPNISKGGKVLWKGLGATYYDEQSGAPTMFSSTGKFNVSGNIMSLLYGDNFEDQTTFATGSTYNFGSLFFGCETLMSAENLVLTATTLTPYCYDSMFNSCRWLAKAPELRATTLAEGCYQSMFLLCTHLYQAPKLSATTLAKNCYHDMFSGCGRLINAPVLPATTLATGCYTGMFQSCISLSYIKAMFTTAPSNMYTLGWVTNVASTGKFVKNSAAQWDETGADGIPAGWTVETASE